MNIVKLFENDFDTDFSSFLCKQVLQATSAFNILFLENQDFFSYPLYSSVKGTLLNYSIEHCLYDSVFSGKVNCKAYQKNVNNFGRSILHIETEHFLLTTAKTHKNTMLPGASKYKLDYALANHGENGQLSFNFESQNICNNPYYVLLTYGYNSLTQECSHVELIIPDSDFKGFIHRKDLLSSRNKLISVPSHQDVEETVAKLKPTFEQQLVHLKIKNG